MANTTTVSKSRKIAPSVQTFRWKGTDSNGRKVSGEIRAKDIGRARAELRRQQIAPGQIKKATQSSSFFGGTKKIKSKDITLFTRQLATLLRSKMPLEECLRVLARQTNKGWQSNLITALRARVSEGMSLADAMARVKLPGTAAATGLEGFWQSLVDVMHTPIHLAGHVDLSDFDHLEAALPDVDRPPEESPGPESTLLRYEGPMVRLDRVMESFSSVMHVMADDLLAFYDRLLDLPDRPETTGNDSAALERKLGAILRVLKDAISQQRQVCIQIEENSVGGEDADWLRPGHYIKYALHVPAEQDAMARLTQAMEQVPGVRHNRGEDGEWLSPYAVVRSLSLFAAHAAEVPAVDTVFTDFGNEEGLATYAAAARRDGFSGMLAIHPAQVDVINRAFVPTAAELDRARRIVDLFAQNPDAGTLGMDGEMIDRPHLVQAQRILQLARRLAAL